MSTIERRWRRIPVSPEYLLQALHGFNGLDEHGNAHIVSSDLPPDATVMAAEWSWDQQAVVLIVESIAFDPVPLGHIVPTMFPLFRREVIPVKLADNVNPEAHSPGVRQLLQKILDRTAQCV